MDDLDFNQLINGNLAHAALTQGASDASLFVSPDQLNLTYGDFSLGDLDTSPPSGATGWESTPESALVSSFSTPLNLNEQIHGGSIDWSNAPLFQSFSTESDLATEVLGASRTSSSSSLPTNDTTQLKPGHRRNNSSAAQRLIERSTVSKRRKTRDVSPIDLDAIKASGDKKEYKKKKNTEAARKSRAAKAERVQALEEELSRLEEEGAVKDAEIGRLKRILAAHGLTT